MATPEQIDDFTAFAKRLSQQDGGDAISLDDIYQRWWEQQHRDEDLRAIQEAHRDYENGERGRPAEEVLAEFRAQRAAGKKR